MDDVTGAPPAVGAGAAPAAPAAPAAEAPMSDAELRDAIASLTPEEATELYNEYARTYHALPPAPLVPTTPAEADARLAQLITDPDWISKLMSGDLTVRDEWHKLNAMKAGLGVFDASAETGDISVGPGLEGPKVSRREAISAAADLRAQGASDAEISLILSDQPYPSDVVRDAHYWLPRMQADPFLRVSPARLLRCRPRGTDAVFPEGHRYRRREWLVTVAGFEKFILDLCGSPFAESAGDINRALEKLDIEADGNPDAERLLKLMEIISNKPVSVADRLEEMQKYTSMKGKVVVEIQGWKGPR
jgi:hypothetical protein